MRYRKALTAAATMVLLAASVAVAADRALSVGIDRYADPRVPDTPGGAADARALAGTMRDRFGFAAESIKLLIDDQATTARILAEFEAWLIDDTGPGDRVFFHYAGHGSQLGDDDGDEDDRWDETLAPFDVDPETGANQIRDDVVDGLIARLSGRRAVLIFDSCHSGTVTRGRPKLEAFPRGGGARYLPRPDQFREIWKRGSGYRTRSGRTRYVLTAPESKGRPGVIDDPRRIGRLSGIVAISAAAPGQLAYPIEVDGQFRGALSYLFQEIYSASEFSRGLFSNIKDKSLQYVGSTLDHAAHSAASGSTSGLGKKTWQDIRYGVTVAALESTLDAGMKRLQGSGRLEGQQEPWFEVISEYPIADQPLFGEWQQAAAVAVTNPVSRLRIGIRTVGDKTVFRSGEQIGFEVTTDRGGFLYLLVFSEQQRASCIFPNPGDPDNRIAAGTVRLPAGRDYVFPAEAPFGRDVVVALVSESPLALCEKVYYRWDEIYHRVNLSSAHQALRQRAIGVRPTGSASPGAWGQPEKGGQLSWQAASLIVETVP